MPLRIPIRITPGIVLETLSTLAFTVLNLRGRFGAAPLSTTKATRVRSNRCRE